MSIIDLHTPTKTHTRVKIVRSTVHGGTKTAAPGQQTAVPHHQGVFHKVSQGVTKQAGSPVAFMVAILAVVVWALTGPVFNYSNTWQLAINTGTTIVTFLMVFAIQNSQNRDSRAMQLKLDELIRTGRASDEFVDLEELDDSELDELHEQFIGLHERFQQRHAASKLGVEAVSSNPKGLGKKPDAAHDIDAS